MFYLFLFFLINQALRISFPSCKFQGRKCLSGLCRYRLLGIILRTHHWQYPHCESPLGETIANWHRIVHGIPGSPSPPESKFGFESHFWWSLAILQYYYRTGTAFLAWTYSFGPRVWRSQRRRYLRSGKWSSSWKRWRSPPATVGLCQIVIWCTVQWNHLASTRQSRWGILLRLRICLFTLAIREHRPLSTWRIQESHLAWTQWSDLIAD